MKNHYNDYSFSNNYNFGENKRNNIIFWENVLRYQSRGQTEKIKDEPNKKTPSYDYFSCGFSNIIELYVWDERADKDSGEYHRYYLLAAVVRRSLFVDACRFSL